MSKPGSDDQANPPESPESPEPPEPHEPLEAAAPGEEDQTILSMDSGAMGADASVERSDASDTGQGEVSKVEGYRVIEPLGRGGMGTVWRAVQLSTSREVALKLLGGAIMIAGIAVPFLGRARR